MSLLQHVDAVELEADISLDRYLSRMYRPDCEYIDGRVRERHAGFRPHSEMMGIVGDRLHRLARITHTTALMSVRTRVSDDCVLVPDLSLAHKTNPREDVIVTPPLLCVEVITPEDTFVSVMGRTQLFRTMGVPHIWLIDELAQFGYYASQRGLQQPADGVFRLGGYEPSIRLAELSLELTEI